MQGSYDFGLVVLSYLIASLAGFVALEFAMRLRVRSTRRLPWLIGGALAMGTGIWSMHFIGMTAFSLPVPISYDIGITFLSWVAAVVVSSIALFIVGYNRLSAWTLATGALFMGSGICLMHYGGMWAMRMDPGISYEPLLFSASVAIAVAASAAALVIIAYLGEVRGLRDLALRVGAALVMGLAVVGMHYTGMAAAEFQYGALCSPANQLPAEQLPWPTTIAAVVILVFGIVFALADARGLAAARRAARELQARVQHMAFIDRETGLPNRARLSQLIVQRIHLQPRAAFGAVTFRIAGHDGSAPSREDVSALAKRIGTVLPNAVLARTRPEHLVALLDGNVDEVNRRLAPLAAMLRNDSALGRHYCLEIGRAHYPVDGGNAQLLLQRSAPKSQDPETESARAQLEYVHAPVTAARQVA